MEVTAAPYHQSLLHHDTDFIFPKPYQNYSCFYSISFSVIVVRPLRIVQIFFSKIAEKILMTILKRGKLSHCFFFFSIYMKLTCELFSLLLIILTIIYFCLFFSLKLYSGHQSISVSRQPLGVRNKGSLRNFYFLFSSTPPTLFCYRF